MPEGGGGTALITIGESAIIKLTDRLPLRDGAEESTAVIVTGYVPAFEGVPESCPVVLKDKPGGKAPLSDQVKGALPPLATVNV
jgi:hypothetical protein